MYSQIMMHGQKNIKLSTPVSRPQLISSGFDPTSVRVGSVVKESGTGKGIGRFPSLCTSAPYTFI